MKNEKLLRSWECSLSLNQALSDKGNNDGLDFSKSNVVCNSCCSESTGILKRNSMIKLFMFFLFTNFLFAQSPACNLRGPIKASFDSVNGEKITLKSEVVNAVEGTQYIWSFITNSANASFSSENGAPSIDVYSGTNGGGFTIQLKIINPGNKEDNTCTCTQSVSVN